MRILIIGAGAIGCFVGAKLARTGAKITLVGRQRLVDAVHKRGLVIAERGIQLSVQDIEAVTSVADAFGVEETYDLAVLSVKSYDTEAAVDELKSVTTASLPILSLQNGVGNEEILAAAFGPEQTIAGAITTPVAMPEPGRVEVHKAEGQVTLALLTSDTASSSPRRLFVGALLNSFRQGGFRVSLASDWRALKWTKLLLNMVGNATSAILDWTPQRVFADRRMATLEVWALREALAVMHAQGLVPISLGGYPVPLLAWAGRVLPTSFLGYILGKVGAGGRGGKMPSLHMDLSTGKGKSEVAYLNGAVARKGAELGIPTPVNRALTAVLLELVRGDTSWEQYRNRPERLLAAVS
jgi:2-dehydropantoate 2-reductase